MGDSGITGTNADGMGMEGQGVAAGVVDDLVAVECERCDAEEFLGFHGCRSCGRTLDPRRGHATDAGEPPAHED